MSPFVNEFSSLVFGINAVPFFAQFVLQYHAKKWTLDSELLKKILHSTFMDDSMNSVENETELRH